MNMHTSILSLDLGSRTGWALKDANGMITSGTEHFKTGRFEGGGIRYLRFTHWLTEIKNLAGSLDLISYEEVRRHVSTDSSHVYGGFMATLTAWCELHEVPYLGVPVGTIKKHATGKGNAGKGDVIASVTARGHAPVDDNEADALALLHWAIEQHALEREV